jgi:phosphonate transport system ATP-binding protein
MNAPQDPDLRPVIEANDVWFAYPGAQFALQGVGLAVESGVICMLLGPSGSGKSTLLKTIKGILRPQRGQISVLGLDVSRGWHRQVRRSLGCRVAYIPQHLGLVKNLTVMENALMGTLGRMGTLASLIKAFSQSDRREALDTLEQLGIRHKADEKVHSLSGGERQRVAIARAFMQRPQLVLADEFVSQLDPVTTRDIMTLVTKAAQAGVTFVITSHEVDVVAEYGGRAVFLRQGRKIHEGPAREVTLAATAQLMGAA